MLEKTKRFKRKEIIEKEETIDEEITVPSCFVIRLRRASGPFKRLVMNWRKIMSPYCAMKLRESSKNCLKDFVAVSGVLKVSHMILFSQTNSACYMKFIKLPEGPTLTFKILNYSLMEDIQKKQTKPRSASKPYEFSPVLILNAFRASDDHSTNDAQFTLKMLSTFISGMFPSIDLQKPSLLSFQRYRRTIMFQRNKNDDTISIRHYCILLRPAGLTKAIQDIVCNVKKKNPIFDCRHYKDISELVLQDKYTHNENKIDSTEILDSETALPTIPSDNKNIPYSQQAVR
jgi:ribosome biogenesis protein SSF1/2